MYKESALRAKTKLIEWGKLAARHWPLSTSILLLTITIILLLENGHSDITKDKHDNIRAMKKSERRKRNSEPEQIPARRALVSSVYTRWGRTGCNGDASLVYAGFAASAHYNHAGGGTNTLCMSDTPEWGRYNDGLQQSALLYGAEYENNPVSSSFPFRGDNVHSGKLHDQNMPCAICVKRCDQGLQLMIPGRLTCPSGWSVEYDGYLMSAANSHKKSEWICVDKDPEGTEGGSADENGALFYGVSGVCGSLPCPPYVNNREITCVVCTK